VVDIDIRDQVKQLVAYHNRAPVERSSRDVNRLMEIVGRRRRLAVAPEHVHRLLALKAMARRQRKQFHKLARLLQPPRRLRHRHAVDGRRKAPQQSHADVAHPPSMPDRL